MKLFLFLCVFITCLSAEKFSAYTEEMPPYNYTKDGKIVGYSVTKLKEILQKSTYDFKDFDITIAPWTRSYYEVLNTKNRILFSTARIPSRENLFRWVGPIDTMIVGLVAKKNRHIKVKNIDDLNQYKIGTANATLAEIKLLNLGVHVNNLDRFFDIKAQIKKMANDRIDMVAFSVPAIYYFLEEMGENADEYELVYLISEIALYYAFHKDTDTKLIQELNELLKNK